VKIQPTLFAQEIAQNLIGQQQFAVVGGFFLGFGCRRRGDDRQPRQNPQLIRGASILDHPLFDILIVGLGVVEVAMGAKDHISNPCRQITPVVGLASLDDDRVALRRAGHIKRPTDIEPLTLVVNRMHLAPIDLAVDKGVILPTVPQVFDQGHKFARPVIARGMIEMLFPAEVKGHLIAAGVLGNRVAKGGDHIPPGAAIAHMVN